ncbi:hypothetical protein [Alteromonas antoniana]|nr:hypothetical protein [Alteromonas antoniana]
MSSTNKSGYWQLAMSTTTALLNAMLTADSTNGLATSSAESRD